MLENPFEVASRFCAQNNLLPEAIPQITEFILKNTPLVSNRSQENYDVFGTRLKLVFDEVNEQAVLRKLSEFDQIEASKVTVFGSSVSNPFLHSRAQHSGSKS